MTLVISNSQITAFNTCLRSEHFRYARDLEPKLNTLSHALVRGIVGHKVWETYYLGLQEGLTTEDSKNEALQTLQTELSLFITEFPDDHELMIVIMKLGELLEKYVEYYGKEPFKVLAVEKVYQTPLSSDIHYSMKLDLLVEFTGGMYRGDIALFDHKFLYNFKTPPVIRMDGQLPRYIRVLQENGITITKGFFNQIRYRPIKNPTLDQLFQRAELKTSKKRTEKIWIEQQLTANKIAAMRSLDLESQSEVAVRNLNPYICKGCYFRAVCDAELSDQKVDLVIKTQYQPNTYGYELVTDDDS